MSWIRIWVHAVFSTKDRIPFLTDDIRNKVFSHMKENAETKDLLVTDINGYTDHAHCLFLLNRNKSLSQTIQLIKGESSNWINKQKLTQEHFNWQDDYWAVSVSERHVKGVREYIKNQEVHHQKVDFKSEIENLMKKNGWTWNKK